MSQFLSNCQKNLVKLHIQSVNYTFSVNDQCRLKINELASHYLVKMYNLFSKKMLNNKSLLD